VENGLGQAFTHMSLVGSLDQLVPVLFVWNNTPTPADLITTTVSAVFNQYAFLRKDNNIFKLRSLRAVT